MEALSVFDRNVSLITTPARPSFNLLMKCCKNKYAVSLVLIGKFFVHFYFLCQSQKWVANIISNLSLSSISEILTSRVLPFVIWA